MVHEHSGSPFDLEAAAHTKLKLYELTDRQIEDIGKSGVTPRTFTIYARTNGTVLKKGILEGAWIDEGTMLFQVADLSTVWALLDIPEDALASVRIGQKVIVTSPAYPHDKFSGTVIFISPVLNATTRTARIRIALANPTQRLKIQMAVEGSIAIASQKTLAIPASAVVHNGDENIVWVKHSGGMFYPQRVELGYKDADGYYAVLSGLDEGDEIAVSGTFLIDSERQLEMGSTSMPGMDMKSNPERQQTSSKNTSTTTK
jgi:Cu(I)/Ag(I) efflux system membrane fusion protein